MEKLRADEVLVGDDAFDGSDDELVLDACLEFLQVILYVWRWRDKDERVVFGHDLVYVAREPYLVGFEMHAGEVSRVVAKSDKLLYAVVASHIPSYVVSVSHHNLGNGRSPASASDDSYLPAIKHDAL